MKTLEDKGKSNVLATAAYVLGKKRFPTDRMPFGLVEHCFNYYKVDSQNEVRNRYSKYIILFKRKELQIPTCPSDYLLWQQSMYNIFGVKWLRLHRGPGLSTVPIGQERTLAECGVTSPLQV